MISSGKEDVFTVTLILMSILILPIQSNKIRFLFHKNRCELDFDCCTYLKMVRIGRFELPVFRLTCWPKLHYTLIVIHYTQLIAFCEAVLPFLDW